MNLKTISTIAIVSSFLFGNLAVAQEKESEQQESLQFCSKFPDNPKCLNREISIELEDRPGHKFDCWLAPNNFHKKEKCKVLVENEQLVVYIEKGDNITELENSKDTNEIRISLEDIFTFTSQWWIADAGRNEKSVGMFSDINVGFIPRSPLNEANKSNFLTISAPTKTNTKGNIYSNKNIPMILEEIESWLYHRPDLTSFEKQFKPQFNQSSTTNQVANNIERLLETNECPKCDLRNADLQNENLKGANLEGANLAGANLEGATLKKAYLLGANLENANLQKANLENAILTFATLNQANLTKAKLKIANLQNVSLVDANLSESKLDSKGLNVTLLQNSNLTGANLNQANLKCANLHGANLKDASLVQTNFKKCKFSGQLGKTSLSNFVLNGARLVTPFQDIADGISLISHLLVMVAGGQPDTNRLNSIGMRGAKFIGETNLSGANLSGADLTEANLETVDLTDANLSNTNFNLAQLEQVNLINANLINAQINNIEMEESNFCNAIMPDLSISEQGCFEEAEEAENKEEEEEEEEEQDN